MADNRDVPADILPEHRLLYVIERGAGEIEEAMRDEGRLLEHDRRLLHGYLDMFRNIGGILDSAMAAREEEATRD